MPSGPSFNVNAEGAKRWATGHIVLAAIICFVAGAFVGAIFF